MKRRWKLIALAVLGAFLLAGCGAPAADPTPKENKEQTTLKIGLLRIDDSLPFYCRRGRD